MRCSHATVQKARHTMTVHQITTREQLDGITDEEMATWFVDCRSAARGDFVAIDFGAVAKVRTGRNKVTLQAFCGAATPPNPPAHPSATTATSASVSLLPNTLMPQDLPHALRMPGTHYVSRLGRQHNAPVRTDLCPSCKSQYFRGVTAVFRHAVCLCLPEPVTTSMAVGTYPSIRILRWGC